MRVRPSSVVLIGANLLPLAGVLLFDWRVFDILMLYWVENIVIGVVNVVRMAASPGRDKVFLIPFFTVHYGLFCFCHLAAVTGLFSESFGTASAWQYFFSEPLSEIWRSPLWIAIAAIAASHLFSFFSNYLGGGEYQRTTAGHLMGRPYGRIVVLHVAIIGGALLIQWLGSPIMMLLVLVAAKIVLDLRLHVAERDSFEAIRTTS